ncbi:MAG: ATP-binding protein [Aquincola tertiaricarbonis]
MITNALLSSAAAMVMGVVLVTRKTYPGFGYWTAGIACLALGAALLVPGVLPPTWATRVGRNGVLMAGHLMLLRGMLVFRGWRVGPGLEAGVALAFLLPFGYLSLDGARLADRIVCYCLFAAAVNGATVMVTLRRRPPHFGSNDRLLALWLLLFALITLVRAAQELADISTAFESIKGFGSVYALAQILSVQLVTLTLVSMNSQRIEWDHRVSAADLQAREQQLRLIGDNLPAGFIYRYVLAGGQRLFHHVSSGITRTFGLTPAAVMHDAGPLFAMLAPQALDRYLSAEQHSAATLTDFHATLLFNLPDGRQRWLDVRSHPQRAPDGATFWDGVALDVTDAVAARARVVRQAGLYRCLSQCNAAVARCTDQKALFDAVCQAIIDAAGMRLAWVSLADAHGRLQLQAQAGAPEDLPPRLHADGDMPTPGDQALRSGQPVWCQHLHSDPLTQAWQALAPQAGLQALAALPVRRAGRAVGTLTICAGEAQAFDPETQHLLIDLAANISFALDNFDREAAREQAQQALDAHRQHLEETVAQRTGQLAEARERAESASLAKTAFLANMSHEIRTPLNAMIGMAHLIRREDLSPRQADRLLKLEVAAKHLLEVLNAVLDLSKIEAGKMTLETVPLRVEAIVANVLSMLGERAEARRLRLHSEVDAMPRDLLGDPTRLQQALLNYANNAIKFTDQGGVTLRARLLAEEAHSAWLRFEVEDTGIGIDPEAMPRLFAAFEQADRSSTRRAGGTGLGLAITRKLATLMGGEAGAVPRPGGGSIFWFTARLQRSATASHAPVRRPEADAEEALRRRHAGARVLLAEDNPVNAEVAQAILEEAGLVVALAVDGEQAVAMALEGGYRLVLMDMQMPRLDGLDACRALRRQLPSATLPVIAMTANAFAEDRAECQAAGMDDFITKPVDPAMLYRLLLHWLDRSPPAVAG